MAIELDSIVLLAQLMASLDAMAKKFEDAYTNSDKKKFDQAKAAILDLQKKISFLLNSSNKRQNN